MSNLNNFRFEFVLLSALGIINLIGPTIYSSLTNGFDWRIEELLLCIATGFIVSQVSLLSTWIALVPLGWIKKLIISTLSVLFLSLCFSLGMRLNDSSMPFEAILVFVAGPIPAIAMIALILFVFRLTRKTFLFKSNLGGGNMTTGNQVSVKQLMIVTAIVAILISLGKFAFADFELRRSTPWSDIISFCSFYLAISGVLALASLLCVFEKRYRIVSVIAAVIVIVLSPILAIAFNRWLFGSGSYWEYSSASLAYFVGLEISTVVMYMICQRAGYCLGEFEQVYGDKSETAAVKWQGRETAP